MNVHLLVFVLDDRLYALRLSQVVRAIRSVDATPLPRAPDVVTGAIDLQGKVVPLLNVRKRFGLGDRELGIDDQFIIANTARRTVAIAVDRVKEIVERPADDIIAAENIARPLEYVEGVLQLDDGLTLIHDLDRFFSIEESNALEAALTPEAARAGQDC